MSCTEQDVRESRWLMNEGCENRLVIGDKLQVVRSSGPDGVFPVRRGSVRGARPGCLVPFSLSAWSFVP
ncbi:hypothetical protein [Streptomyces acidiscabies]|uniref:hypothetical protein n=1 Tax=Streptomyces acidiscabies TaxID=42234 RepID=UPI000951C793|nr:hypothetical protein [Streptomyces acidiscabies]